MKKTRLTALVLTFALALGSFCGCRRNETADTDKDDLGSKRAAASDTGDGKETDPGDSTASSQDPSNSTAQRDPSKITIAPPDDSVVRGMADEWRSNNSAIFVLTDHGEYRSTDENMFFSAYLQLTAEYVFSEEYYEMSVAQMNTADMTYDEYVEDMLRDMPDQAKFLGPDHKLKELPDERIFFVVSGRSLNGISMNAVAPELIEQAVRTGMDIIFADSRIQAHLEQYIKNDELTYDMPYVYGINIAGISSDSAYVIVQGISLDGSQEFTVSEFVSLSGATADLLSLASSLRIETSGASQESSAVFHVEDKEQTDALLSELLDFCERNGVGTSDGPWYESDGIDFSYMNSTLVTVTCQETQTEVMYLGNGDWLMRDFSGHEHAFRASSDEESRAMLDQIYEAAAGAAFGKCGDLMTIVDGTWAIDRSAPYDAPKLEAGQKNASMETIYTYISESTFQSVTHAADSDSIYVCENTVLQTDATVDDVRVPQDLSYYELIIEGGVGYARYDTVPVYTKLDDADIAGVMPFTPFAKTLDLYDFVGGFAVSYVPYEESRAAGSDAGYGFDSEGHRLISSSTMVPAFCEFYRVGDEADAETIAVLLDEDGKIIGGWEYGAEGLTVYYFIGSATVDVDLQELSAFAEENTEEKAQQAVADADKSAADWQREDLEAHGFFDLSGVVTESGDLDESPVVQGYIDYFQSLQPFSLEMWTFGAYKIHQSVLSFDGADFYDYDGVSSHDGSFDYVVMRVRLGDTIYTATDDGMQRADPAGPEFSDAEILYSLPDIFIPGHKIEFLRAYTGTLDGREFVVEEWSYRGVKFTFYCQDGEILAVKYPEFGSMLFCYFSEFTKSADYELIKKPY